MENAAVERGNLNQRATYPGNILIVEDDPVIRSLIREALQRAGHYVAESTTAADAHGVAGRGLFDVAVLDVRLPDNDGVTLMRDLARRHEDLLFVFVTAVPSVELAVEAMKLGAWDYITKPFEVGHLVDIVNRAVESSVLRRRARGPQAEVQSQYGVHSIIGTSAAVQELHKIIRKVARSEANTILLRGESGVGKDLVARAIHSESPRSGRPFMTISCTTLQETLLESELFGHERGAFTDAKAQKKGLFELAAGGTVFLDEIGDMGLSLQAKLLQFLEHKTFRRVGGTEDLRVDVRVIAATNRDLESAIRDGTFREDLYYRLNVIPIYIPPLRERPEDIRLLVNHFIQLFNREFKKNVVRISKEAIEILTSYSWPGNIRELRNVMERAMLLCPGNEIQAEDLLIRQARPTAQRSPMRLPPEGVNIEELERSLVVQALERTGWNRAAAARLLGCSRYQIRYRIKKFGLARKPQ